MDFKFTGTRDEDNPTDVKDALAVGLVMVDEETTFVHATPVPIKEVTGYLVEEACRVLMLMQPRVFLRTDTEPVMISLRKKVQGIRKLRNLDTEIQDVSPDEHQGLTVRNLSRTLVHEAEMKAKVKMKSESTSLLNRFVVSRST